jgi:hypothetical protein
MYGPSQQRMSYIDIMTMVSSQIAPIRGSRIAELDMRIFKAYLQCTVNLNRSGEHDSTHSSAATAMPTTLVPMRKCQYSSTAGNRPLRRICCSCLPRTIPSTQKTEKFASSSWPQDSTMTPSGSHYKRKRWAIRSNTTLCHMRGEQ